MNETFFFFFKKYQLNKVQANHESGREMGTDIQDTKYLKTEPHYQSNR